MSILTPFFHGDSPVDYGPIPGIAIIVGSPSIGWIEASVMALPNHNNTDPRLIDMGIYLLARLSNLLRLIFKHSIVLPL